jgi:hypothetical protein
MLTEAQIRKRFDLDAYARALAAQAAFGGY